MMRGSFPATVNPSVRFPFLFFLSPLLLLFRSGSLVYGAGRMEFNGDQEVSTSFASVLVIFQVIDIISNRTEMMFNLRRRDFMKIIKI